LPLTAIPEDAISDNDAPEDNPNERISRKQGEKGGEESREGQRRGRKGRWDEGRGWSSSLIDFSVGFYCCL
jgi:hypothetical protein